jgi:hypothetical protein
MSEPAIPGYVDPFPGQYVAPDGVESTLPANGVELRERDHRSPAQSPTPTRRPAASRPPPTGRAHRSASRSPSRPTDPPTGE